MDTTESSSPSPASLGKYLHPLTLKYRFSHGLCPTCGTPIYNIQKDNSGYGNDNDNGNNNNSCETLVPLTLDGVVKAGRCLYCYPDRNNEDYLIEKASKRARSDVTASFTATAAATTTTVPAIKSEHIDDVPMTATTTPVGFDSTASLDSSVPRVSSITDDSPSTPMTAKVHHHHRQHQKQPPPPPLPSRNDELIKLTIRDSNDNIYVGTITEGNEHKGNGTFTRQYNHNRKITSPSTYEGEFENGKFNGFGILIESDGARYEGEFHKGSKHGFGIRKCAQGWTYEGQWVNGKREGQGKLSEGKPNGETYDGEWKNDKCHGYGELFFHGGGKYAGEFKNDQHDGMGEVSYVFADGSVYNGEFKEGFRVGYGTIKYADGSKYKGDWQANCAEGNGTLFFPDGSKFVGKFKADKKVSGTLYLPNGAAERQTYDKNGKLIRKEPV